MMGKITLNFEIEESSHGSTLMIPSKEVYIIGIIDLQDQEKGDNFNTELATINIVPEKEVVFIWYSTKSLEDIQEIKVLTMDIPNNY